MLVELRGKFDLQISSPCVKTLVEVVLTLNPKMTGTFNRLCGDVLQSCLIRNVLQSTMSNPYNNKLHQDNNEYYY